MTYTDEELLQLGIKRTLGRGRGSESTKVYIYECPTCGNPVKKFFLILDRPIYCNLCRTNALERVNAARKEAKRKEIELNSISPGDANKKIRFQKAASKMDKLGGYDEAIKKAKSAYRKYDSVPEAVAAIILLHCGYRVIAQQPVSDYKLDFVLPDEKIVIEVDGSIYHTDELKREIRDTSIKYNLGSEWEILHIPAESLMKRPKVFERLIKKKIDERI